MQRLIVVYDESYVYDWTVVYLCAWIEKRINKLVDCQYSIMTGNFKSIEGTIYTNCIKSDAIRNWLWQFQCDFLFCHLKILLYMMLNINKFWIDCKSDAIESKAYVTDFWSKFFGYVWKALRIDWLFPLNTNVCMPADIYQALHAI